MKSEKSYFKNEIYSIICYFYSRGLIWLHKEKHSFPCESSFDGFLNLTSVRMKLQNFPANKYLCYYLLISIFFFTNGKINQTIYIAGSLKKDGSGMQLKSLRKTQS